MINYNNRIKIEKTAASSWSTVVLRKAFQSNQRLRVKKLKEILELQWLSKFMTRNAKWS